MFNTYIANDCVLENNIILSRHVSVLSNAYIDNFVTLSDFVRVKQNISIGSYSFLGTGSIISKDILPYFSFFGEYPDFRSLNLIMFKKFFFKHSSILRLKKIYNLFFYYNLSSKQIISLLLSKKYFSFESKLIVTFLLKSKKGLVK
ncbi:MAG TPA: LbetaH domain-containing protein [Candidatus Azoamicus sp.]